MQAPSKPSKDDPLVTLPFQTKKKGGLTGDPLELPEKRAPGCFFVFCKGDDMDKMQLCADF